ncbi:unnamed protein product [Paramecium primaurelia]|uniref:Uncharacterized protein n=1 Tax=Paramecium primaurelia TaxID=5886 RepID=A0A8S1NRA1_PARPR|nr:unnamed protein product [Paramecium primaurelia]
MQLKNRSNLNIYIFLILKIFKKGKKNQKYQIVESRKIYFRMQIQILTKKPIIYDFIEQDPMLDLNINSILFSPNQLTLIDGCSDVKIQVFELISEKLNYQKYCMNIKNQEDYF